MRPARLHVAAITVGTAQLGVCQCPGATLPWLGVERDLGRDLAEIASLGFRVVATLLEDAELEEFCPDLYVAAEDLGLALCPFPIPDMSVPEDLPAFAAFVAALYAELAGGRGVVVHCLAGLGRSGLVASCLGVAAGAEPAAAVRAVRAVRPGAVQTDEQRLFVDDFAAFWATRRPS